MAERLPKLVAQLETHLSAPMKDALEGAVSLAEERGLDLYMVGGGVRDLLLGAAHVDVDLVVEGDAIALATALGRKMGARVVGHPRFGTAVVSGEGFRLDLAQARSERYERPGALPSVQPAALEDDLSRRDFTINAIALRLAGARRGELLDPHDGRGDLDRRLVRVLHDDSFRDDATRLLRALRYAGRLDFEIEPQTLALLRRDLSYLDAITGARVRYEFERIAGEERVAEIVARADALDVLAAAHPALRAGERELTALCELPSMAHTHRDAALFCVLLAGASASAAEGAIARLHLTGRQANAVRAFLALGEARLAGADLRPSEIVSLLARAPLPAIEAFALLAREPLAAERARRYLAEWRHVRPRLNGRDIEALGVPHGPRIGEALALLRQARLDGRTQSREDEVELVRSAVRSEKQLVGARHG
jgi:tRNA nucleotidyltransferase (CCA-adding enzyme)